jgi:uncharacterized membrane protein
MDSAAPGNKPEGYRLHPHVLLVHFPISFFVSAFGFQVLHLFMYASCFELATNALLAAGTIMLIPTVVFGWRSWKRNYRGAGTVIFRRKIVIAFTMAGLSIGLSALRFGFVDRFTDDPGNLWHWAYLAGNTALIFGALAEGFYGGRLNHH